MKGKQNMKTGSMMTVAYEIISGGDSPIKFVDLWEKVKAELEISAEEEANWIGSFYTDLSLDARFCVLNNNYWDLTTRHTLDEIHDIDLKVIEEEVQSGDAEDIQEEAEYNASVQGISPVKAEDGEDGESEDDEETKPTENAAELLGNNY